MEQKPQTDPAAAHQSDQAEGELDTVEESIRIHEKKRDLPEQAPPEDSKHAA